MKLTDYCIIVPIKDAQDRHILINTLNGNMHVMDRLEAECIETWGKNTDIIPNNIFEKQLYSQLLETNYLFNNEIEESEAIKSTLELCKKQHRLKNQSITDAVFVLTYQCNFACPYCYETDASNLAKSIMTKSMIDQIFSLHQNHLEKITFYGGEPFLLPNREIIKYIISKAPQAIFSATTNGYFLEEYFDVLQQLKISYIMVTLDGPQEIHNQTRILKNGKGTFEKIERGIRLYLEHAIPIKIRMNISNTNLDACLELRKEYINTFPQQYNSGLLFFELQPVFQLPIEERKNIEQAIYFAEEKGGNIIPLRSKNNTMVRSMSYPLRVFVQNMENKFRPKYTYCDAESSRRFYDADGNIYSCILALGNPQAAIGSYYPEVMIKSNSMLDRNIESIEVCSQCKLRFFCGGGCANEIIDSEGNTKRPNCAAIKRDIFVELPQLFRKYVRE